MILALAAVMLAACHREKELTPTPVSVADKFPFPQEGTPADAQAVLDEIYELYGVKVIYKDFTEKDLNRSWLSPSSGAESTYTWDELEGDKLRAAAETLRDKVFGLLPAEIVKVAAKSCPYLYLTDNLLWDVQTMGGGGVVQYTIPTYPQRALDGMAVNLQMDANPDDYKYKVFYPALIAGEFFNQAFNLGAITLSKEFYSMLGPIRAGLYDYNLAARENDPERYWARQGHIPRVDVRSGNIGAGKIRVTKSFAFTPHMGRAPLTGTYAEIPDTFLFLCLDRNWRTYDDEQGVPNDNTLTGVFYDCPRLVDRLELFTAEMARQGIDFDEIQEKLYAGTTVNTDPSRIYIDSTQTPGDPNTYIY